MNYSQFQKITGLSKRNFYNYMCCQDSALGKKASDKNGKANLKKIFNSTIRISNKKGFKAMTLRELSRESNISLGALYTYFKSKEQLLEMLQQSGRNLVQSVLSDMMAKFTHPREQLEAGIRSHIYLSEIMQPWFYFSFMEAKNLSANEQKRAVYSELFTEEIFAGILKQGQDSGEFIPGNHTLGASTVKALLQDWYLKRSKYRRRKVHVDEYADFVVNMVSSFFCANDSR